MQRRNLLKAGVAAAIGVVTTTIGCKGYKDTPSPGYKIKDVNFISVAPDKEKKIREWHENTKLEGKIFPVITDDYLDSNFLTQWNSESDQFQEYLDNLKNESPMTWMGDETEKESDVLINDFPGFVKVYQRETETLLIFFHGLRDCMKMLEYDKEFVVYDYCEKKWYTCKAIHASLDKELNMTHVIMKIV